MGRAAVANAVLAAAVAWAPAGCGSGPPPAREYFASEEAVAAAEAIRRGRPAELHGLIAAGLDVDHRGSRGMNLLKWALASNCPECFEALLEAGASTEHFVAGEYTGRVDQLFLQPLLDLAASADKPAFLALALEHGADPDARDVYGSDPVMFSAILYGRLENVRLLAEAGANVNARSADLTTPVHFAVGANRYEIACYLLEQGADPSLENKRGSTVGDYIRMFGDGAVSDYEYDWYVKFREKIGLAREAARDE